jgi:hypothetical protein
MMVWLVLVALLLAGQSAAQPDSAPIPLNYDVYRSRIEPIFLKARAPDEGRGHSCFECHTAMATRMRLQPLNPEATEWTPEQSRQNFAVVSRLVTAGDPLKSRLLLHPLAPSAGGDPTHTGGKFWE